MAFHDSTYYVRDINLTAQQLNNISGYIDRYEYEILVSLLGDELYEEFENDLNESGEPQSEKFTNLLNGGVDFTFTTIGGTEVTKKWKGLIQPDLKKSVLAYFTFFNYLNENETQTTTVGQKKTVSENSESVSALPKLTNAWNRGVNIYGETPDYFRSYHPDYFLDNDNYEHWNGDASAYNYLLANISDFSNWVFTPLYKRNFFGI